MEGWQLPGSRPAPSDGCCGDATQHRRPFGPVPRERMVGPMKPRKTYRLVVEREPGWWIVQIPELDLTTQARRLGDVEKSAREAIAALLDVGTVTFDVEQDVRAPVAVVKELDEARALMDRAAILREESADRIGQAVDKLIKDFGVTMREAGKLLDLSHQRIAQLVERARRGTRV